MNSPQSTTSSPPLSPRKNNDVDPTPNNEEVSSGTESLSPTDDTSAIDYEAYYQQYYNYYYSHYYLEMARARTIGKVVEGNAGDVSVLSEEERAQLVADAAKVAASAASTAVNAVHQANLAKKSSR